MILLIVDTQKMIVTEDLYKYSTFVHNVKELIHMARKNSVEVIYIRHDDGFELTKGVEGFDIYEEFAPAEQEKIFDKHVNSVFKESGLLEYLRAKKENTVMLAGLQTDYCIDATVKCGFEHGFKMVIPELCNTTVDNEFLSGEKTYQYYNEKMWKGRYAECISFEKALERLGDRA
ncbi:MAG: isochorismatase family protein [Clostridiales bacterium]|nr:isochorismatase family protein [Clostridiales bacterium]